MSNDLYDDLTDEEKAILKREIKFRIAQQKARENAQAELARMPQMPAIIVGSSVVMTIIAVLLAFIGSSPEDQNRFNEAYFFPMFITSSLMILFACIWWLWQKLKGAKNRDPKNKRD